MHERRRRRVSNPIRHVATLSIDVPDEAATPWFTDIAVLYTIIPFFFFPFPFFLSLRLGVCDALPLGNALSDFGHSPLSQINFLADDQLLVLENAACAWPSPSTSTPSQSCAKHGNYINIFSDLYIQSPAL